MPPLGRGRWLRSLVAAAVAAAAAAGLTPCAWCQGATAAPAGIRVTGAPAAGKVLPMGLAAVPKAAGSAGGAAAAKSAAVVLLLAAKSAGVVLLLLAPIGAPGRRTAPPPTLG